MRVCDNHKTVQKLAVGSLQARSGSMFLPQRPRIGPNLWENVTTISEAVGKGDPRVRCNHCLKEYKGGCIRIRGRLLANPKSGVSMCDKCPPAVRSMLAGKEETAAAEKSARLSCSWPRLLPMPGGCRQGLCSRPYTGKLGTWVC